MWAVTSAVEIGPCGWEVPDPTCCPKWETAEPVARTRAKRWAAWLLWSATGRQLGRCETSLRPCRRDCGGGGWPPRCAGTTVTAGRWFASAAGGAVSAAWGGASCGCQGRSCSCTTVCEVELPGWWPEPVRVRVHGQEIPLCRFRVDDGHRLVWEKPYGGGCECEADPTAECDPCTMTCFPACQDLTLPPEAPGTWEITYLHGVAVPEEGLWAAAELACEILKSFNCQPGECRLPSNIISMTRNNTQFEFANNGEVTNGRRVLRFNIPIVDMWVQSMNPYGDTGPVTFFSPDVNPGRVQTWP